METVFVMSCSSKNLWRLPPRLKSEQTLQEYSDFSESQSYAVHFGKTAILQEKQSSVQNLNDYVEM